MKKYYPYPSDRKAKKFYIITDDNKKIYFGDSRYQHYTEGHLGLCARSWFARHPAKIEITGSSGGSSHHAKIFFFFAKIMIFLDF